MRATLGRKAALLLLSLVVAMLAAEASWRFHVGRRWAPATRFDEALGWRYKGSVQSRHRTSEFDVEISTDKRGHRVGREAPFGSRRDRVVFLGDSLTFGWGVEFEESFPALVGRWLDTRVVNLGVAGYATGQQYLTLQREGLPLAPTSVVLTYSANDLLEVTSEWQYGWTKPRFRLDDSGVVLSTAGERAPLLERYSSVYRSARFFLQTRTSERAEGTRLAEAKRLVQRLIRAMANDCRVAGAGFLVVHTGESWLARALEADSIGHVDVGPALRRAASDGPVSFSGDPHWNAHGHRVVAKAIEAALATGEVSQ